MAGVGTDTVAGVDQTSVDWTCREIGDIFLDLFLDRATSARSSEGRSRVLNFVGRSEPVS